MFGMPRLDGFGMLHGGWGIVALVAVCGWSPDEKERRPHRAMGDFYAIISAA